MLDQFAEELLEEKGLKGLDPEVHASLVDELRTKANELINRRIIDSMSEEQLKEFNKLIDTSPSESQVQAFIESNVPKKHSIAASALIEFKMLYLNMA